MRNLHFLLLGILLLFRNLALAVSAVWVGDTGNWSNAAEWSTNPIVPDNNQSTTYDVTIGQGFSNFDRVTLDSARHIQNLTMMAGSITASAPQTLDVVGSAVLSSGSILGAVNINFGGSLNLSGNATFQGTGTSTLLSGATAQFTGGLIVNNFINQGAATFSGAGISGTGIFTNQGTVNVASTASIFEFHPKMLNNGLVTVNAGQLWLLGGGSGTGAYSVSADATLDLIRGTFDVSQNSFSGTGTIILASNQSFTLDSYNVAGTTQLAGVATFINTAGSNLGTLSLNNGILQGSGPVHVTSAMDWFGGTLDGTGGLYIDTGAIVTNTGITNFHTVSGTLTNNGTINWTPGSIGGAGTIRNEGAFNASGTFAIDPEFVNGSAGKLNVGSGTMTLDTASNAGRIEVAPDGTLMIHNSIVQTGGMLVVDGGAIFDGSGAASISVIGGMLEGTGTIGPTLTNAAFISPGLMFGPAIGTLTLFSDLTLVSTSQLLFDISGRNPGAGHDFLSVAGSLSLNLDGTLDIKLDPGFVRSIIPSDVFTIMSSNQRMSGSFSNAADGGRLQTSNGQGSFVVRYADQNSVTLSQFEGIPEPASAIQIMLGLFPLAIFRHRSRN